MKRLEKICYIVAIWLAAIALAFALAIFWYYLKLDWLKWITIPAPLLLAIISTIFLVRAPGKKNERKIAEKKQCKPQYNASAQKSPSASASPKAPCNNDCSNVKEQELEETVSNITDQELLEIENQLRSCDTKDLFFKYYQMFAYSPHLSENSSRSPITAAYLFVIFDCIAFAQNKREKSYEILSLIENEILSPSELDCYDKCVNIFGAVARGEITPRGDWMFFDGDTGGNWLYALYLCYGDLIRYPAYLSDYEHHPIIIHDYFELMKFSDNFSKTILLFTREFTEVFSNSLGK